MRTDPDTDSKDIYQCQNKFLVKPGERMYTWSPRCISQANCQISRYFAQISHFGNWISPWKNNVFCLNCFPDKVWLCRFDFWHLREQSIKMLRLAQSSSKFLEILWFFFKKSKKITKFSKTWKIAGRISPFGSIARVEARNRIYTTIPCQEKNPDQKILIFHGEI